MNTEPNEKDFLQNLSAEKYATLDVVSIISMLTNNNPVHLDMLEEDLMEMEERQKKEYERCRKAIKHIREHSNHAKKLEQSQVALIYIYQKKIINKENAGEIAKSYGHSSGNRLYNCYTKLSSKQNRTGGADEQIKFVNRRELIESVIPFLSHNAEAREWAMKESDEMKTKEDV